MTYLHYVGLDLGQSQDYTALAVVEEPLWVEGRWQRLDRHALIPQDARGWVSPAGLAASQVDELRSLNHHYGRPADPPLSLRHLERFPLGTGYPEIVSAVAKLMATPPLRAETAALVVDMTGVGRPVVDLLRRAGLDPQPVTITAGNVVTYDPTDGWRTPKRDLISAVSVLLEGRRLKIAEQLPEAGTLVKELQAFKRRVTDTAHDQYTSGREQPHDDLVLAAALACWFRSHLNTYYDQDHADRQRRRA